MFNIYKKCEKSIENPYGVLKIENPQEIDQPFLLCLAAQTINDKSIFGVIKEGARAARVRTTDELAGGFKINEVPVHFLGVKSEADASLHSLCDDFIYPFLTKDKDLNNMKKRARMIHFFTYCDAAKEYVNLEKKLIQKLLDDGFSNEEIKDVLSQIAFISIASEVDISSLLATSVLFKDVNDSDVYDVISKFSKRKMEELNRDVFVSYLRKDGNPLVYAFNGDGEHLLREYLNDNGIVKSSLSATVSMLLENAIQNQTSNEFIPISPQFVRYSLIHYSGERYKTLEQLSKLDSTLSYHNAPRYSVQENKYLNQLDALYKELSSLKRVLQSKENELKQKDHDINLLIQQIQEKSSDIAFSQIVLANGLWNGTEEDQLSLMMKTDREVREEYNILMKENENKIK